MNPPLLGNVNRIYDTGSVLGFGEYQNYSAAELRVRYELLKSLTAAYELQQSEKTPNG